MEYRIGRLFHTLVVFGGSLSGCGAQATSSEAPPRGQSGAEASASGAQEEETATAPPSDGTIPSASAGSTLAPTATPAVPVTQTPSAAAVPMPAPSNSPASCASSTDFTCDDYATVTGCRCQPANPDYAYDCDPWQFVCAAHVADLPPEVRLTLGSRDAVGCRCDPDRLSPDDCAERYQFICDPPYSEEFKNCRCDETALSLEEDPRCCIGPDWGCNYCNRIR